MKRQLLYSEIRSFRADNKLIETKQSTTKEIKESQLNLLMKDFAVMNER